MVALADYPRSSILERRHKAICPLAWQGVGGGHAAIAAHGKGG
jgi:hypothetical protein